MDDYIVIYDRMVLWILQLVKTVLDVDNVLHIVQMGIESGVSAVSSAVSDDVKFDIVLAMEDCPAGAIKFSYQ